MKGLIILSAAKIQKKAKITRIPPKVLRQKRVMTYMK